MLFFRGLRATDFGAGLRPKCVRPYRLAEKFVDVRGADYAKSFDAIYPDLAAKYGVPLYPFFLEGVALDKAFTQPDGLHPTGVGVAEIVKRILPDVEALVQRIEQSEAAAR